jgi:hypothetical protein
MATTTHSKHAATFQRINRERERHVSLGRHVPLMMTPLSIDVPIAAADLDAADRVVLFSGESFPPRMCYLVGWRLTLPDLDSDGTPACVHDVDVVEADGTLVETVVSASQAGRAGGEVTLPERLGLDLAGRRIELETTTAPDAAQAGTAVLRLLLAGYQVAM